MEGLYKIISTTPAEPAPLPRIDYDFAHDVIKIDGIPFTTEFFYFLAQGLEDGDLFEITRRGEAISLRKVISEKPHHERSLSNFNPDLWKL